MSADIAQSHSSIRDEVTHWFFDDYLRTWIGVGAGTIARGPEFILDYWSAPLHWSDDQGSRWFPDAPAVVALLDELQTPVARRGLRVHRGARPPGDVSTTTTARRSR